MTDSRIGIFFVKDNKIITLVPLTSRQSVWRSNENKKREWLEDKLWGWEFKKDYEKESEREKESEQKKESENKKESEKKIESGKNERKTKK